MPGAFAKTKKATNILRPAIDVIILGQAEKILGRAWIELKKKKNRKKLFSPYKSIDSENFIKVSQNPNKVARDTQGLPTVPHKGLASKYLLLMATSPYKVTFSKKKSWNFFLESEKTSDSALSGVVRIEIWSSFLFCVSSFWATARQVNGEVCPILL